jgi:hypothetical protein
LTGLAAAGALLRRNAPLFSTPTRPVCSPQQFQKTGPFICGGPRACNARRGSDSAHQGKDYHDKQDETEAAARIVSPPGAVRPRGQRADKQRRKHDASSLLNPANKTVVNGKVPPAAELFSEAGLPIDGEMTMGKESPAAGPG